MIWKYLQVVGLRDGKTYFELNLVFDNCAGQNKNRMVIRLLFFLVKMKIFKTARAIFLIKGHTKNDCDRMFNLMKQDYRKTNCYTPPELNDLINKHPLCTAIPMLPNDFLDWDALQNKMVDKADGILKNHIFTVKSSDSNNVWIQEYNGAPISKQMLVKNAYLNSDWRKVFKLDVVPPPKLPDIKWNELYYKWGRFVPEDRKKGLVYFCKEPPASVKKKINEQVQQAKQAREKRSRGADSVAVAPQKKKPPQKRVRK